MSSTTVAEFANELKKSADVLLDQLRSAGVSKASEGDALTDADKQKLLSYLQASHGTVSADRKKITLVKKSTSEIKQADASRIYGLELEEILSPNQVNYLYDRSTLVEEHIVGIPGDVFSQGRMYTPDYNQTRIAKECVKFNER